MLEKKSAASPACSRSFSFCTDTAQQLTSCTQLHGHDTQGMDHESWPPNMAVNLLRSSCKDKRRKLSPVKRLYVSMMSDWQQVSRCQHWHYSDSAVTPTLDWQLTDSHVMKLCWHCAWLLQSATACHWQPTVCYQRQLPTNKYAGTHSHTHTHTHTHEIQLHYSSLHNWQSTWFMAAFRLIFYSLHKASYGTKLIK